MAERFAVIDTETNWENNVMSIGIVIAEDGKFEAVDYKYIIFEEAARVGGMFTYAMILKGQKPEFYKKEKAIETIKGYLDENSVKKLFAYNASFDARCLPELCDYCWHDIVSFAAYRQHNPAISEDALCYKTGRLKRGYKVEDILWMFGEDGYMEKHNALTDAMDELRIMGYLKHSIEKYPVL